MVAVEPIDLLIFEPSLHRVGDRIRQLVPGIRLAATSYSSTTSAATPAVSRCATASIPAT
jgi:hypothetical protein